MKSVLVIDAPPMLREFLKEKLTAESISFDIADGHRDALTKFLSILPDLVIINIETTVDDILDFLNKKQADPNGKKIPVIMCGPVMERDEVTDLVQYGVVKYFTKPIKFDLFFDAIGRILHSPLSVDTTPCMLDVHLNHDIIFVEVALGLNREKITLLKYKLSELIENNKLNAPKIILMMTDLSLSFVDGYNLDLLLKNLTSDKRILKRNVKILSLDTFVSDFVEGHPVLEGVEVAQNLSSVLNSLVEGNSAFSVQDVIMEKILAASDSADKGSLDLKFFSDTSAPEQSKGLSAESLQIALVDSDPSVITFLTSVYQSMGAEVSAFSSSAIFAETLGSKQFDLAVIGMFMQGYSGLDLLKLLVDKKITLPVIVYSQIVQKEVIMQSLTLGASSYLIKPQPSEVIIKKSLEIIHAKRQY